MKALKKSVSKFLLLLSIALFLPFLSPGQGNNDNPNRECKTFLFRNLEDQSVTDLHIKFNKSVSDQTVRTSEEEVGSNDFTQSEDGEELNIYLTKGANMGEVPAGGAIEVQVCAEEPGLEIEEWHWTRGRNRRYGTVRNGTVDNNGGRDRENQDPSLIVPSEDYIEGVSVEQNIRDFSREVNDLHIVLTNPALIKRLPEGLQDNGITECDCSQRQREEPCRSLCEGAGDQTLYVINLEGEVEDGEEVSLELWGEEPFEIRKWWWTTNGYPINVDRNGTQDPEDDDTNFQGSRRDAPPTDHPGHSDGELESTPLDEIVPPIIYNITETRHGEPVSTGETTGTVALVDVTNPNPYLMKVYVPDAYIKGRRGGQPFVTNDRYQNVPANRTFPVGIQGYCVNVGLEPNPAGEAMTPIKDWIIPGESQQIFNEDWQPRNPRIWDEVRIQEGGSFLTIPGTDEPLGYAIDMSKYPETGAPLLIEIINRIEAAADSLSEGGVFHDEFRDIPAEEVAQQTIWMAASELDSSQPVYTADDFRERTEQRFEDQTGTSVNKLPDDQREQFDNSVSSFLSTVSYVGEGAKVKK